MNRPAAPTLSTRVSNEPLGTAPDFGPLYHLLDPFLSLVAVGYDSRTASVALAIR
jgi:hypothetical protein